MIWQFYLLIFGALFAFIAAMLLPRHWMHALQVSNAKKQRLDEDAKKNFGVQFRPVRTKMNRACNG